MIFVSCKKETEKQADIVKSDFNLKTDITDFKKKMTELDTIKIWFNHSVCTYEGYERMQITKKSGFIKIRSEYKGERLDYNPEWSVLYEKTLPETDTMWKFENFVQRNLHLLNTESEKRTILEIKHEKDTLRFKSDGGLAKLNLFLGDYYQTMRKIHPENKNNIYGVEAPTIHEIIEDETIETE